MSAEGKVLYYETSSGKSPVFEFIQTLEMKTRARITSTIDLLIEHGINLGLPYSKKLTGSDLWEIRVLGTNNLRIFYVAILNKQFLLLHGFKKKKQKTDKREIIVAEKRLQEYTSRN
jgi:phage-related protein